jgi:hypothetical protein
LLYRELDKAYPDSKFILTIRDEEKWVKSVERLWDRHYNPSRGLWDVYPFSNTIHTVLYGQKDFDAEVMLKRYRRHNAEVREYFKDKNNLLIMEMDNRFCGWDLLCDYLNAPIPDVPYPWEYKTRTLALPVFEAAFCSSSDGADAPDELTEAPDVLFPSADNVPVPKPPLGKIRILAPEECPNCGAPDWNSSLPDEPAECRFCRNVPTPVRLAQQAIREGWKSVNQVRAELGMDSILNESMQYVAVSCQSGHAYITPGDTKENASAFRRLLAFLCHLLAVISKIFRKAT